MPGLRSLLRIAPFLVGAVAAPAPSALEAPADASQAHTGRFNRQKRA